MDSGTFIMLRMDELRFVDTGYYVRSFEVMSAHIADVRDEQKVFREEQ